MSVGKCGFECPNGNFTCEQLGCVREKAKAKQQHRKYSVAEIDQMRSAVERGFSRPADPMKAALIIEDRLRTYMLNGTEPEELERAAEDFHKKWLEENRVFGEQHAPAAR